MPDDLLKRCERWVADGLVTAVSIELSPGPGRTPLRARAGRVLRDGPPLDERSLFDLASLTKPWTATLALWLDARRELPLATRLGDVWPQADGALATIELEELLWHRAGFARWRPLYALCRSPEEVRERLLAGEWLQSTEVGARPPEEYSDLDYLLWSLTAERATGRLYRDLVAELAAELGVADLVAAGSRAAVERGVECPLSTGREVELAAELDLEIEPLPPPARGQVQDGNARFLGGSAGHAGLFASLAAMAALVREWQAPGRLLPASAVERALRPDGHYALGWFRSGETAAGRVAGGAAFGHDGFTGGSVWIEPEAGRAMVMLAHRASLGVDLSAARADLVRFGGSLRRP